MLKMKLFIMEKYVLNIIFYFNTILSNSMNFRNFPLLKNLSRLCFFILIQLFILTSCEEFFEPDQDLVIEENDMFRDWSEYRSAEMGLYALQQNLVEQILILGELRGDLLKITENATPDLVEVHNFTISKENKYASPFGFYELIAACNNLGQQIKRDHPEVLDKNAPITNYDRLYGEVVCMRAWAFFNAVRIYGEIPYVHESLTSVEEIEIYVNSPAEYIDTIDIIFVSDGYYNDTIYNKQVKLEKKFLNQAAIIDTLTYILENEIKAVGVNHSINNGDQSWGVTVWNEYAKLALLGQMYLFDGNYTKAMSNFNPILFNYTSETNDIRYGLDNKFAWGNWSNIFTDIDSYKHILTIWFGKSYFQTHNLQRMFSSVLPNEYMIKPTTSCILNWESQFNYTRINIDYNEPDSTKIIAPGVPGDFNRGYGVSYGYFRKGYSNMIGADTVQGILFYKMLGNEKNVQLFMDGVDTVVHKYSIGKDEFAHDANFIIYRAGGIHLYASEIYALWEFNHGGIIRPETNTSLNILNNGSYNNDADQLGVRGRVGFGRGYSAVQINNIIYIHDPHTFEILGYYNYTGNLAAKQKYLINKIMDERARELAFEGERFYDLMRIAKRRNDPSYLADKVAAKFDGPEREVMRNKLMNEENWYVPYFKDMK